MKCSIHENGYERYICAACAADPINIGWDDGVEIAGDPELADSRQRLEPGMRVRARSARLALVARLLGEGKSQRVIARQAGCSRALVRKYARRLA